MSSRIALAVTVSWPSSTEKLPITTSVAPSICAVRMMVASLSDAADGNWSRSNAFRRSSRDTAPTPIDSSVPVSSVAAPSDTQNEPAVAPVFSKGTTSRRSAAAPPAPTPAPRDDEHQRREAPDRRAHILSHSE